MKSQKLFIFAVAVTATFLSGCAKESFSKSSASNSSTGSPGGPPLPVPAPCSSTNSAPITTTPPPGTTKAMLSNICPAVGSNSDCTAVIVISDTKIYVYYNTSQPAAYDGKGFGGGNDDTIVGVLNISNTTINNMGLSSNNDIFGFDGDGIDTLNGQQASNGMTIQVGSNNLDATGYGGANAYYSFQSDCNPDKSEGFAGSGCDAGIVNFIQPVGKNGITYFGLENALQSATACLNINVNN